MTISNLIPSCSEGFVVTSCGRVVLSRLVFGAVLVCVLAGQALGVQTPLLESQVKEFLASKHGVTVDDEISRLLLVSGGFEVTAWGFGGILPQGQAVSGLVDPTGVVRYDMLGSLSLNGLGLGKLEEAGVDIGPNLNYFSAVYLPVFENESAFLGLSVADPHYGWMEISLPGGVGTAPLLLDVAIQPIPDTPIKTGASAVPESGWSIGLLMAGFMALTVLRVAGWRAQCHPSAPSRAST